MRLTTTAMDMNSTTLSAIPEVNYDEEGAEEMEDKDNIKQITNTNSLLTTSSSKETDRLLSRSPSPSPSQTQSSYSSKSTPIDRALNQKFHIAALTGNLDVLKEIVRVKGIEDLNRLIAEVDEENISSTTNQNEDITNRIYVDSLNGSNLIDIQEDETST